MRKARLYRWNRGLTEDEVGKAVGVTYAAISRFEAGKRMLREPTLRRLAAFFATTLDEITAAVPDQSRPKRPLVAEEKSA